MRVLRLTNTLALQSWHTTYQYVTVCSDSYATITKVKRIPSNEQRTCIVGTTALLHTPVMFNDAKLLDTHST
jgi:hypothetical protein